MIEHVFSGGDGSCFSGVQALRFARLCIVNGHKKSTSDASTLRVNNASAEKTGNGRVHRIAPVFHHISIVVIQVLKQGKGNNLILEVLIIPADIGTDFIVSAYGSSFVFA